MKTITTLVIVLFATVSVAQTGSIQVYIKGVSNNKGNVQIGLYSDAVSFPKNKEIYRGASVKASKGGISYLFQDIPSGIYALASWHDENTDKELNKNFFGMPIEPYGFSLNKRGSFGPPDFEDVAFEVGKGEKVTISITLK